MKIKEKAFLFGGSFNPVHSAHVKLVRYLLEHYNPKRILIMPAYVPPHKLEGNIISYRHRFAMLRIAFAELMEEYPKLELSQLEKSLPPPNYTYRTLRHLSETCPTTQWSLVMGYDTYLSLPYWKNPIEIMGHYPLIVFARKEPIADPPVYDELHHPPEFLDNPLWEISSTDLRKKLKTNQSEDIELVKKYTPPEVFQYILDNNLLQDENGKK